ncbi:MAG: porin family protein [Ignavibacteria bacterium]|nr:porin family protein [Ignavibacteria bacterium]
MYSILCLLVGLLFVMNDNFSQQKFNISAYGGYSLPVSDLKGEFPSLSGNEKINFFFHPNYLTSSGYNIGTSFKYTYDSSAKGRLTAGLNFSSFSGKGTYTNLSYKNSFNIFTISGGAEFLLSSSSKTIPFVGAELTANFFSGKVEATGDTNFTANRKSESRFGLNINGGVEFKISKTSSVVLSIKYCISNMLGRKTESLPSGSGTNDVPEDPINFEAREIPLNDAETSFNKSKSIHHIQFSAGISFGFGGNVKKHKK